MTSISGDYGLKTASEPGAYHDFEVFKHVDPHLINGVDQGLQSYVMGTTWLPLQNAQHPVL